MLPIAIQAYQALRIKVVSIDVLVTIAVVGAFIIRNYEAAIVTFYFCSALLEQRTLSKTRSAIKELTEMAPETALKLIAGAFEEVDVEEVEVGDVLLVKTGRRFPWTALSKRAKAMRTKRASPGKLFRVEKVPGSKVYAGTILENGTLRMVAERGGGRHHFREDH